MVKRKQSKSFGLRPVTIGKASIDINVIPIAKLKIAKIKFQKI